MSDRLRPERRAAPGKFCIWTEAGDAAEQVQVEFDTAQGAHDAAAAILRADDGNIEKVIIYDDRGFGVHKRPKE